MSESNSERAIGYVGSEIEPFEGGFRAHFAAKGFHGQGDSIRHFYGQRYASRADASVNLAEGLRCIYEGFNCHADVGGSN